MEITFKNYKLEDKEINLTIMNNQINGITGNNLEKIKKILQMKKYSKNILINNKNINKKELLEYRKKIAIIDEQLEEISYKSIVYDYMLYEIERKNIKVKDYEKKIVDSLRIVGIDKVVLRKNISMLSTSERKLLQLAISLLSNPEALIFIEPLNFFDLKREKKLIMLLQKLKEQYNKTIIFISEDIDMLYKYSENIIIYKNNEIIIEGNSKEILENVELLKKNKIDIPQIVEFTFLARKKYDVKIDYHKDIRDIIKDIYKHV